MHCTCLLPGRAGKLRRRVCSSIQAASRSKKPLFSMACARVAVYGRLRRQHKHILPLRGAMHICLQHLIHRRRAYHVLQRAVGQKIHVELRACQQGAAAGYALQGLNDGLIHTLHQLSRAAPFRM